MITILWSISASGVVSFVDSFDNAILAVEVCRTLNRVSRNGTEYSLGPVTLPVS